MKHLTPEEMEDYIPAIIDSFIINSLKDVDRRTMSSTRKTSLKEDILRNCLGDEYETRKKEFSKYLVQPPTDYLIRS